MAKMKAAILKEFDSKLVLEEIDIPKPKSDEVLIRVMASGLCASDLHIRDGKIASVTLPYTPGHETVGEIVEVGSAVTDRKVGDYVVAAIDLTCKQCEYCLSGRSNLCRSLVRIGFERNGGHAEYCAIPAENAFLLSRDISPEAATSLVDALGCMYNAIRNRAKVKAADKVLIMGVGGLGLNGLQLCKYFGADVYCSSREDDKLNAAKELGSLLCINSEKEDLNKAISDITNGLGCDVVIDNIGIQSSVNQALKLVKPGGKVIVCGYIDESFDVNYQEIMKLEKEILGVRGMSRKDLFDVIKLVENKKIKPFVYKTISLDEINEGLAELESGKATGRIVVKF